MGAAFLYGGGSSNAFAAIAVTYPSGSICTCTKGTKVLRARDTSGTFLFLVPESGTWTIACTNGTLTTSANVVITTEYQVESVTLAYILDLYNAGDENTAVTGGWVGKNIKILSWVDASTTPTVTKNATSIFGAIYHVHGTSYCGIMGPTNAIDLSAFSTLKVNISAYAGPVYLYVHDGTTVVAQQSITQTGEISLDISSVTGSHNIGFGFNTANSNSTVTVTRCTLYP